MANMDVVILFDDNEELTLPMTEDFYDVLEDEANGRNYEIKAVYIDGLDNDLLEFEDFDDYDIDEYMQYLSIIDSLSEDAYETLGVLYNELQNLDETIEMAQTVDDFSYSQIEILDCLVNESWSYEDAINKIEKQDYNVYDSAYNYGEAMFEDYYPELPSNIYAYIDFEKFGKDIIYEDEYAYEMDNGEVLVVYM